MIDFFKPKRASSVLGIALDGNRLEVIWLRRTNGTIQIKQSLVVALALSPLNDAPELVGQEIRNHLDKAAIREKRCVVCVPLNWILTQSTQVPEMSDEDRASFLQLEAERGFHSGSDTLLTASSIFKTPSGDQYATLMAAPRANIESLQRVLRGAKLKPLTFGLGITAMQPPGADAARTVVLAARQNTMELQVTGGGGIVAIRSLDNVIDTQGAMKTVAADLVAREIRITLGQLPSGLAEASGKLKVFGQGEMVRKLIDDLGPFVSNLGMKIEPMDRSSQASFDRALPAEIASSAALALGANYLRGADSQPEFLPPRVQPWKQLVTTRLSPRKLAWAGAVAGVVALGVAGAFGVQQYQISKLQTQWNKMEPAFNELTDAQNNIQKFRGWYEKPFQDILAALISAFPEDGAVVAKTVELREMPTVTCSGTVRDNNALMQLHDKLAGNTNEISALHSEIRGQKPMQFTLTFQWGGAVTSGN